MLFSIVAVSGHCLTLFAIHAASFKGIYLRLNFLLEILG